MGPILTVEKLHDGRKNAPSTTTRMLRPCAVRRFRARTIASSGVLSGRTRATTLGDEHMTPSPRVSNRARGLDSRRQLDRYNIHKDGGEKVRLKQIWSR